MAKTGWVVAGIALGGLALAGTAVAAGVTTVGAIAGAVGAGVLAGTTTAVVLTVIDRFWTSIAQWLNNTAANVVDKMFGYNARKNMHRAITCIGNIKNNLVHQKATIFTKKNVNDSFYQKITYGAEASTEHFESEIIDMIQKEGELMQTFEYKG